MAANLAPVYVNENRVVLQGDPKPKVAKIVAATGKRPEMVEVVWLKSQTDQDGRHLRPDEVIDRTQQSTTPVYLRCFEKGSSMGSEPIKDPSPTAGAVPTNPPQAPEAEKGFGETGEGTPEKPGAT